MASLHTSSPIDGRSYAGKSIWLSPSVEYNFTQIKSRHLTGNRANDALTHIGADAPPRTFNSKVVWVGPDERLLLSGELDAAHEHYARDATSGLIAIAMKGASVRRLVENETSAVDFTPGFASRLRFADLAVIIIVRAADDLLCLVERSAAAWLFDWLENRAKLLDL